MVTCITIPPMGHSKEFYQYNQYKNQIILEYPYNQETLQAEDSLEYLANYFAKQIKTQIKDQDFCLIGVSLGATLSLRINELLENKAHKLILMASGGLKVARARKEMIAHAITHMPAKDFIDKALALDSSESFLSHFDTSQPQVLKRASDYYPINKSFWSSNSDLQKEAFVKMAIDALNVDYQKQLELYQDKIILLWSENDKIFSMRHFRKFQKIMPQAQCLLFEGLGHYLPLEAPQHLDKIVEDYVFNI